MYFMIFMQGSESVHEEMGSQTKLAKMKI